MNWDDLKYYLAVARQKSLSDAARGLKVSPSTVSRRIAELEHALGTELFIRHQDGYELNEAGRNLLSSAEEAEANLIWLERGAIQNTHEESGVVRIAAPELIGQYVIIPRLVELQEAYPGIQLEISTDVRSSKLTKREADIVVRLDRPTQGDYTVQSIGKNVQHFYASKTYLQKYGALSSIDDLEKHQLIGWDRELSYLPLARYMENQLEIPNLYLRTTTLHAQLMAVQANMGIAVLPKFAAEQYGLEKALVDDAGLTSDIWLAKNRDSKRFNRVNVVADHITTILSDL